MSQSPTAGLQRAGTDDRRTALDRLDFPPTTGKRAVYEEFEFSPAPGRVEVTNASHGADADAEHTYTVDVRDGVPVGCECPADEYHAGACKHRVAVALRESVLEAAAPEPTTDGGTVETAATDDVDERPDDCDCAAFLADADLPCWPCYREGFETPAPSVGEGDR